MYLNQALLNDYALKVAMKEHVIPSGPPQRWIEEYEWKLRLLLTRGEWKFDLKDYRESGYHYMDSPTRVTLLAAPLHFKFLNGRKWLYE